MLALVALAMVGAMIVVWLAARSAITVCVLDVVDGEIEVRRGAIAPRILADIGDVVERPKVVRATLRIVRNAGKARLEVRGTLSGHQEQRIRNVVGSVPLAKLANGRRRR